MRVVVEHACLPARGETDPGDAVFVRHDSDALFFGVLDVLGHGPRAAEVASLAVQHLDTLDSTVTAFEAMESLHGALRGTRGAAATLCTLRDNSLEGCGVGNVELRTSGTSPSIMLSPGILGQNLRKLHAFEGRLQEGDRIVCFSDGISRRLALADYRHMDAKAACERIVERHRREHDDASVLVIDLEGSQSASKENYVSQGD